MGRQQSESIEVALDMEYVWTYVCMYICIYGHTYSKSMDQPGKVANPARGQLNSGEMHISLSAFAPENLASRDGFGI